MHAVIALKFTTAYRGEPCYYVRHPDLEATVTGQALVKPARSKTEDVQKATVYRLTMNADGQQIATPPLPPFGALWEVKAYLKPVELKLL